MARRQRGLREDVSSLCAEVGPEDGLDPRKFFRPKEIRSIDHKALRLAGHVARTLALSFPGGAEDAVLSECAVVSVEPCLDGSRLLVTIGPARPGAALDPARVLERIERVRGHLRAEVAASLRRKRAPELVFRVAVADAAGEAARGE